MVKTLADISEAMRDIDFCTLATHTAGGSIGARPMSNNRDVDYTGDAWFFTYDDRQMVAAIGGDPNVGVTYQGSAGVKGMLGAPGAFFHVVGQATLVRDKAAFAEHWDKSLDRWFPQGVDTPDAVMIAVKAQRLHYWDGEEEDEVKVIL